MLENFKCFGPGRTTIDVGPNPTPFIGTNGTGKTAACEALLRLFGITGQDRAVRAEDFHVPVDETEAPTSRELTIEAVLAFPELDEDDHEADDEDAADEVADLQDVGGQDDVDDEDLGDDEEIDDEDLNQDEDDQAPEQRIVSRRAVPEFFSRMAADDDGERAAQWSADLRDMVSEHAADVAEQFAEEPVVKAVEGALGSRWRKLHDAGTHAAPKLRLRVDRHQRDEVCGRPG
ncbi:MAG TPA: hypothetical protein VFY84_19345 [Jiangellales bacterium]|nr:hypothetical protein [Jiangellales bacterium]